MAPAPKPVPKPVVNPKPQQLSPTQAAKQQAQQQQQLAQQLRKEITKTAPQQRIYPVPPTPAQKLLTPTAPMTNGYDERDKDELVIHSRSQQPFKTISQTKSALTGQKGGF
jgi:CHAT domain-containing protein